MHFYLINESLNLKMVGQYPQVEEAIYFCNVWDEARFIDNVSFKQLDFDPITAHAKLVPKARLTDLISAGIIGFHRKLLVSGKLKAVIQGFQSDGLQFHRSPVVYQNIEIKDYWVLNPFEFHYALLDFTVTEVYLMENTFNKVEKIPVDSYKQFLNEKYKIGKMGFPFSLLIENVHFLPDNSLHFLVLQDVEGGTKYYVSETLKQALEYEECTGLEFQPCYLSLNEWLKSGGEREKIYGKI